MADPARSPFFRSHAVEPMSSVLINPNGNPIEYIPCVADEALISAALFVYITAGSYPNEVSIVDADHGDDADHQEPMLVEIEPADSHMATNYDKTTTYSDGDPIPRCLKLYKGMHIWAKGSTLTAGQGEILIHASNGLLTNVGDPDASAIDKASFAYRALTPLTTGTWIPVEVLGREAYDNSA